MKITTAKTYVSAIAVAATVLSAGAFYTINITNDQTPVAHAYTSAVNAQDPATALDDYVVTIPDANLRKALNKVIAAETSTQRTDTQAITAGEMRRVTGTTANFDETGTQNFLSRSGIKDLEGIQFLTNAESINLGVNLLSDVNALQPLSGLTKLKRLNLFHTFRTGDPTFVPPVTILDPIKSLPALESLHLNTNNLTPAHLVILKDAPKLKTLLIAGNNVLNLQDLFKDGGFATIDQTSTFSSQKHEVTLTKDQAVFANPVRDYNGAIVPITETATVKNVDASGQSNQTGGHIKLVDLYDKNKLTVNWATPAIDSARFGAQTFTGSITVNYDLPPKDSAGPVFSPAQPPKIISRKGVQLELNDVTATDDESGLSPTGVTYNHGDIGLNPANPVKGNYTLTYTAEDNAQNRSTVTREIEITDADALQAKVTATTDDSLTGYTADSQQAVKNKRAAAEAVIARNDAPQAEIDQALDELNQAIAALQVDTQPVQAAIEQHNQAPEYIQQDPAVQQKLAAANAALVDPAKTPASVRQAADELIAALDAAKQQEANRQAEAAADIAEAQQPGNQSPLYFNTAQAAIDAVKDPVKKAELQTQLDALKQAYDAKLNELRQLLEEAKKPELTDGMTDATKQALQQVIATATTPATDGDVDQAVYDTLINDLRTAMDGLTADKTPLEAPMTLHDTQPDYIKNNPAVAAAFRKAQGTHAMAKPPVKAVRDDAKALEDAINAAIAAEATAQQTADAALQQATDKLNEQLAPGEMPQVDIQALEAAIAKVQDPAKQTALQAQLDTLKAKLATRQQQVDDYKKSEEGKRAEAERQARDKAKMNNGEKLSDTGMPVAAPALAGLGTILAGVWALVRRKR